jgi:hypothetical protein
MDEIPMSTVTFPHPADRSPSDHIASETLQIVKHAVKAQEQLWACYRGRVQRMWPHALGWRAGRLYVLAFFLDAAEPAISRWEWIPVNDLGEPRTQPGVWIGSPRASRPSSEFLDHVLLECEDPVP